MSTETLIHLDPTKILAEDNIRFGNSAIDVAQMQEDILKMGYITTPVVVERISNQNGFSHRLVTGFRRHAAALNLNATAGAGLTLPAIERDLGGDAVARLTHQISENLDRKNMTQMDMAKSIKALMDAGKSRTEVRAMFPRPGGKKGAEMQPASNSWINMMLGFLELPVSIQKDIDSGILGTAAGYELTKCSPDRRQEILAKAKERRQADLDREAAEEKRYLEAESKVGELVKEEQKVVSEVDLAKAEVELADLAFETANDRVVQMSEAARRAKGDKKKAAEEAHKAAEADFKGAEKRQIAAHKQMSKLVTTKQSLSQRVEEMKARLTAARKAAKKGGKGKGTAVGAEDVKRAAKDAGDSTENVKLNAAQMRKTVEDLTLAGTYEKVQLIGAAIKACFDGEISAGQLLKKLAVITGESSARSKTAPTAPDVKQGPTRKSA